jgi:1-acyl-sn-glycerol-3-phosphate acyltransferase
MFLDLKRKTSYHESFNPKRKEPYVMLANHTFLFDVVQVPMELRINPFIVASHNLFLSQPLKFLLSEVAHAIPKSKGKGDLKTAKELISAVKRGYPILIFPEGNTTFNGETNYVEASTMKLIKKLKVDLVICHVKGGYLSKPRWATGKRKNRKAFLDYKVVIPKEELKEMTVAEISDKVNKALYNNDYDFQRKHMIPHPGKELAEGIENLLYLCPECNHLNSIESKGNELWCNSCHTRGHYDEFGFIHGFKYDNLVEWDAFQKKRNTDLQNETFESVGKMYRVNDKDYSREYLGEITITYKQKAFHIKGDHNVVMPFERIKVPTITLRRDFNLYFDDVQYMIKIEKYVTSFLRVAQNKY